MCKQDPQIVVGGVGEILASMRERWLDKSESAPFGVAIVGSAPVSFGDDWHSTLRKAERELNQE